MIRVKEKVKIGNLLMYGFKYHKPNYSGDVECYMQVTKGLYMMIYDDRRVSLVADSYNDDKIREFDGDKVITLIFNLIKNHLIEKVEK